MTLPDVLYCWLMKIENYLRTKTGQDDGVLNTVIMTLSSALNDPVEVNRELAVKVFEMYLDVTRDVSALLPSLVPVLVMRLGQKDITEHSEEVRFSTMNLLYTLVTRGDEASAFLDDYISILQKTFVDPYHEVKKLSCKIAVVLSERKCHRFYQISESILSPMLSNLTHQHSKVRLETVRALEKVLLYGQGKFVENIIPPLTQRLFDSSSAVRQAVIQLVGSWLLDLPDRYSYHTKLLPLLLSGLTDESDEIREVAVNLWHHIGLKFEKENEEHLKDKMDFDKGAPFSYPYECRRPVLGCRELIYRSASRLFPALCKDLSDWQEATRLKAASLVPILILHLEESATQHTQHLLTGIGNGLADALSRMPPAGNISLINTMPFISFRSALNSADNIDNTRNLDIVGLICKHANSHIFGPAEVNEAAKVINQLFVSTQILGCMISTKFWWHLLEPCLRRCTESVAPASLAGHLFLLSGLLYGSPLYHLVTISNPSDLEFNSLLKQTSTNAVDENVNSNTGDDASVDCQIRGNTKITHVNENPLHQIIAYLSQNEIISVVSISAKASLLVCIEVCIRRLEESVLLLKQEQRQREGTLATMDSTNDMCKSIIRASYDAAKLLTQDTQIRSWLFEIILGLSAIWPENDLIASDFGRAILNLCDKLLRRLAACHRDCVNLNKETNLSYGDYEAMNESMICSTATTNDVNQLFFNCMPKLIERLNEDLRKSVSWHPRSTGLAILSRCLQLSGPALLIKANSQQYNVSLNHDDNESSVECLTAVLDLLERGCRLDHPPGGSKLDKSPGGTDPLTLASEAEIRLRGLMILTRLTENSHIRVALASPKYLNYCLSKLILPVCVWRAGRTSEAMRKAAVTSFLALLAAAVSINDLNELVIGMRTIEEIQIDKWLYENTNESFDDVLIELTNKKMLDSDNISNNDHTEKKLVDKYSNLPNLSSSVLSLMLARLGSLLDDDLEGTRRMACICLTMFFNGLLLPSPLSSSSSCSRKAGLSSNGDHHHLSVDDNNVKRISEFLNSSTWIQPLGENNNNEAQKDNFIPYCPLPNSFGDQVYRFSNNFIKRLNDSKDQIRLLICETVISWIRLLIPMLTATNHENVSSHPQLNPVYTVVIEDFLNGIIIHLDDPSSQIRAAVSRVILRMNQFTSDLVIKVLMKAKSCHRFSQLCDQLLQFCHSHRTINDN
ncbi:unnamed protein product [Heterobilharzia americana]|nr:unnamed protein product [Heterobilharzia americana]